MRGLADQNRGTLQPIGADVPRGPELVLTRVEVVHPHGPVVPLDVREGAGTAAVADTQQSRIAA